MTEATHDNERVIHPAITGMVATLEDEGQTGEQRLQNQNQRQFDQMLRSQVLALSCQKVLHRSGRMREWLDENIPTDIEIDCLTAEQAQGILESAKREGFQV